MGANDPLGVANLDPRGMVGRIYVGDHLGRWPAMVYLLGGNL